jgi:F-type H+-transporting ATPase subunit epsilon
MEGEIKFHTGSETTYGSGIRGIRELSPDTDYFAAVASGMMRIEDNDVLILVDSAEWPDEIDEERAIQRAEEAREIILQKRSITEYALAEATLRRSIARQRLKQRNI